MGLVLIVAFLIQLQFNILTVNIDEFYPVSIRSVGFAVGGAIGSLGAGVSQLLFTDVK